MSNNKQKVGQPPLYETTNEAETTFQLQGVQYKATLCPLCVYLVQVWEMPFGVKRPRVQSIFTV